MDTVNVFSIDTVPLNDYSRTGANRYGNPTELGNKVQTMKITQDKGWTFTIDKANKTQSQMVMDAGAACARQMSEVIIPFYDAYVFRKLALAATANGQFKTETINKGDAYSKFLDAQETLGNKNVPDAGRVCLCSYAFANKLKQDPSFMRYGDMTQEMLIKGVMGEVDGVKIVKVPASRLPEGCNFILTHPMACVAPRQLNEYKIHTDAPGISGWLTLNGQQAA